MRIETTSKPIPSIDATWLAIGLLEEQTSTTPPMEPPETGELLARLVASKDLPAKVGDTTPILGPVGLSARGLLVFGLGPGEKFHPRVAFEAGVALARRLAGQ